MSTHCGTGANLEKLTLGGEGVALCFGRGAQDGHK